MNGGDSGTATTLVLAFAAIAILVLAAWIGRRVLLRGLSGPVAFLFHLVYYYNPSRTWRSTYWLGTRVEKIPLDLWIYQEIIFELRPDVIIECGTNMGGSALFFASMFDLVGRGRVVTIDINSNQPPQHERIQYLVGSSTSPEIVARVRTLLSPTDKVMVVLDSDHSKKHVLDELRNYAPMVSKGQYLVVEDTNLNGYPVGIRFGPGPMEALRSFLKEDRNFAIDRNCEKLLVTFNPRGWLRRVS